MIHAPQCNRFKVGFTSSTLEDRVRGLQSPCELIVLDSFQGRRRDEYNIHKVLSAYHWRGEWYEDVVLGLACSLFKAHHAAKAFIQGLDKQDLERL